MHTAGFWGEKPSSVSTAVSACGLTTGIKFLLPHSSIIFVMFNSTRIISATAVSVTSVFIVVATIVNTSAYTIIVVVV